ncbi:hypothetical protein IE077_003375 [Cardiosporidium cionae]|uniref:RRM domain-containing protein n=1 Tax=Cardiosporidium cionae TaxID=476202 RepID=A0ABQ7J8E8_9APIC|nr:hypothetical protein IE077_003375 [Cardiosporidium cionae]|eukprot:KAF8820245.1 hypothetical protein IE077_003375 [Cardiosporidium cionae]
MLGRRRPAPSRTVNVTDPPPKKKWQLELEKNSDLETTLSPRRRVLETSVTDDEIVNGELLGPAETKESADAAENPNEKNLTEKNNRVKEETSLSSLKADSIDESVKLPTEHTTESDTAPATSNADSGSSSFSNNANLLGNASIANGESASRGTKRKRYEWMDSDDEDITSSSEEEKDSEEIERSPESVHGHKDELPAEVAESTSALAETTEDESHASAERLETVRFAFVSNISWEAKLDELAQWIEQMSGQRVLSLSTEGNIISNAPVIRKSGPTSHKGRVFIELENHQALLDILRLNERSFMGRSIRIIRAYKRDGQFFLLQSPAHFRFFYQQKQTHLPSTRPPKSKQAKVDGGFNWAR